MCEVLEVLAKKGAVDNISLNKKWVILKSAIQSKYDVLWLNYHNVP